MFVNIIKKIIIFLTIFSLIQPFSPLATKENQIIDNYQNSEVINKKDIEVFGFIILNPSSIEISNNPELQYETLNLINDILRNNISIFWSSDDIELLTNNLLTNELPEKRIINRGSFFIPFIEQQSMDIMSIIIISKYFFNNSSQLDNNNLLMINEPIQNIKFYKLHKPNIAYYFDQGITRECINWYMDSLKNTSFLNSEILDDVNIINKLNNDNYNILIWPGGNMFDGLKKNLSFFSILNRQYSIKNFISNGGGYVGSCYGAFMASSGISLTPFFLLQYYFPRIPTFGFFSLSDTLLTLGMPSTINVSIESSNSPVVFGLNGTLTGSSLRGGPVFTWVGTNSESLATIEDINTSWIRWIDSLNSSLPGKILRKWANFTIGKTIWISSEYNKGKIVSFGDHPEHGNIKLQRAVHNSVLYVTSELIENNNFHVYYPTTYVENNVNKSRKTKIDEYETDVFINEFDKILNIFKMFSIVENQYDIFSDLVENLTEYKNIDLTFYYQMMRGGLWKFDEFTQDSIDSLSNSLNDEDIIDNLKNIYAIYYSLLFENISIANKINLFKNDINNRLGIVNNTINSLIDNFDQIIIEIENYQNNTAQNQYIITLSEKIEMNSIEILNYLPSIHFDSIMFSRDLSYLYKYIIIKN